MPTPRSRGPISLLCDVHRGIAGPNAVAACTSPSTGHCALALVQPFCSDHPNRDCNVDAECDRVPGACVTDTARGSLADGAEPGRRSRHTDDRAAPPGTETGRRVRRM